MSSVRVLFCAVGSAPEERDVSDDLRTLQALVGGVLEMRSLPSTVVGASGLALFCHEEGRLLSLPPNRWVPLAALSGAYVELVMGPLFFARVRGSDLLSLRPEEVAAIQRVLSAVNRRFFT